MSVSVPVLVIAPISVLVEDISIGICVGIDCRYQYPVVCVGLGLHEIAAALSLSLIVVDGVGSC